jgi:hypothetical protein
MPQRHTMELFALNAMLLQKNKEFIQAMSARKPHGELVALYNQVKRIYAEMGMLKEQEMLLSVA